MLAIESKLFANASSILAISSRNTYSSSIWNIFPLNTSLSNIFQTFSWSSFFYSSIWNLLFVVVMKMLWGVHYHFPNLAVRRLFSYFIIKMYVVTIHVVVIHLKACVEVFHSLNSITDEISVSSMTPLGLLTW